MKLEACEGVFKMSFLSNRSTLNLSNGETESVKTMIVHDDVESEPALTPSKEGTLIVRQVMASFQYIICSFLIKLTHSLIST